MTLSTADRRYLNDKFTPVSFGRFNAQFRNIWTAGEFRKAFTEITGQPTEETHIDDLIVITWR